MIQIHQLSKKYLIDPLKDFGKRNLSEELMQIFRPKQKSKKKVLWALKEINLEIHSGEIISLIGTNGSGKSTLLKLIARVSVPTNGKIILNGRVGALLELGTGFHIELTGRENIFLAGAILGMSRKSVKNHFEEIVAFSEIEEFLDTPIKRYSSGMFLRLAFSVMAHLNAEILLIDEILAVGDERFQKKCLEKMQSLAKQGRTIILVTHQAEKIRSLCTKTIWLEEGRIVASGNPDQLLDQYECKAALHFH